MDNSDNSSFYAETILTNKNIIFKALFILVVSIVIGILVYTQIYDSKLEPIKNYQNSKIVLIQTEFAKKFSNIRKLTQVLANNEYLKKGNTPRYKLRDSKSLAKINKYFSDFGLMTPIISQIRWLDLTGSERFRVNFKDGKADIVQPQDLQNKMSRYYFREGLAIQPPNFFMSRIDLNVEYDNIVKPYEPTIRVTYRTDDKDYIVDGLIIVNFNLSDFFKNVKNISTDTAQIGIVNRDGYWLFNHEPEKEWGFMLDKPELNIAKVNPELWQSMRNQKEKVLKYFDESMYTLGSLPTLYSIKHNEKLNDVIYIYVKSDDKTLSNINNVALGYSILCSLIFLIIGSFILYREYRYNTILQQLFIELNTEKIELKSVNKQLSNTIQQQQLLQESFIEAQKLSSLGLLVAGVAHEMNTPVGGAIISVSNAQSVLKRLIEATQTGLTKSTLDSSSTRIKENLDLARINLDKAALLVKSFKKMAIDRNNEEFVNCNIKHVIEELLIALNSRLKTSKVKINTEFIDDININSRPGIISQVIENLIINALSHGFKKNQSGEIEIKVEKSSDDEVSIIVADTGCGIEKERQKTIFEPFHTSARGKGNIGLGLYMVSQWVTEILKGKLDLESDPNATAKFKTRFIIRLCTKDKVTKDCVEN